MLSDRLAVAGAFALYGLTGYGYLCLLGAAAAPWLIPLRWRSLSPLAMPYIGWALLVAIAYPLNASVPGRYAILGLAAASVLELLRRATRQRRWWRFGGHDLWLMAPLVAGVATYVAGASLYVGAGTLSTLVADSDVEHFADVIGAMLRYPIGWSLEAQMGLEATPVGLAYHYVHGAISAVTGADTFATAAPSHLLMLSLAPGGVYLFARSAMALPPRAAGAASVLYACGGLGLEVVGFGWGQQTAALATIPIGVAALDAALAGNRREAIAGGLLAALAAGSLYLASGPLVAATAVILWAAWGVRGRRGHILVRAALLAGTMAAAGALSHLSAAGFFLTRGGLQGQDVAGRSTHIATFASLEQALAVQPVGLLVRADRLDGSALVAWAPWAGNPGTAVLAAAGLVLVAVGCFAQRRSACLVAFAAAAAAFETYLRLLRPFPYGEFKLLTAAWFLVPCLVAAGARAVWLLRNAAVRAVSLAAAVAFAVGLLVVQVHVRSLLGAPWGAALPESEMAQLRALVAAVPPGAAVWVSNQLVPRAAVEWRGVPTLHRAGFASQEAGAGALATRWRGAATALFAFSSKPAYGNVQRHSTELRAPLNPLDADYVVLDESEDPLLVGLVPGDVRREAGRLRLYRSPVPRTSLPESTLPIGESLPGRRQGLSPRRVPQTDTTVSRPEPQGSQVVLIGLFAVRETEADIRLADRVRRLALFPGLSWYVSVTGGSTEEVQAGPDVIIVSHRRINPMRWLGGEALLRSPGGVAAPLIVLTRDADGVGAAYVNLSASLVSTEAHLVTGEALWLHGQAVSPPIVLNPLAQLSFIRLNGAPLAALWLDVGPGSLAAKHALPVDGAYSLPLLGEAPALDLPPEGSLVKGSSSRLYAVERGELRWVPTLEALERRAPVARIVTLPDVALWRLPVGLPID